jgi:hypothetical protein
VEVAAVELAVGVDSPLAHTGQDKHEPGTFRETAYRHFMRDAIQCESQALTSVLPRD